MTNFHPPQYLSMIFIPPSIHPHTLSYFGVFTAACTDRLYNVYTCYKCDYTHPPVASNKTFYLCPIPTVLDFQITHHTITFFFPTKIPVDVRLHPLHTHTHTWPLLDITPPALSIQCYKSDYTHPPVASKKRFTST